MQHPRQCLHGQPSKSGLEKDKYISKQDTVCQSYQIEQKRLLNSAPHSSQDWTHDLLDSISRPVTEAADLRRYRVSTILCDLDPHLPLLDQNHSLPMQIQQFADGLSIRDQAYPIGCHASVHCSMESDCHPRQTDSQSLNGSQADPDTSGTRALYSPVPQVTDVCKLKTR